MVKIVEFGMKVFLEFVFKNIKDVQSKVQDAIGKIDLDAVGDAANKAGEAVDKVSGGAGKKPGEGKSAGLLGGILKALGPLSVLLALKPIADIMKILLNFTMLGILVLFKFVQWIMGSAWADLVSDVNKAIDEIIVIWGWVEKVWGALKDGWELFKTWFGQTWEFLKGLPIKIWAFLKELPGRIWSFMKALPGQIWAFVKNLAATIWGFMKSGFAWVVDKLTILWSGIKEKFAPIIERLRQAREWMKEIASKFSKWFSDLPTKIWTLIQSGFQWVRDKVQLVIDNLVKLPGLIWDKLKALGTTIASAIKGVLPRFLGGGKKGGGGGDLESDAGKGIIVDDALITKSGQVIRLNPRDNILATQQNPLDAGGKTIINNFYGVTPEDMMDFIRRELGVDSVTDAGRF